MNYIYVEYFSGVSKCNKRDGNGMFKIELACSGGRVRACACTVATTVSHVSKLHTNTSHVQHGAALPVIL